MAQTFCARWCLSISGPYFLHLVNMTTLYRLRFRINSPKRIRHTRSDIANAKDAADDLLISVKRNGKFIRDSDAFLFPLLRISALPLPVYVVVYTCVDFFVSSSLYRLFFLHICYSVYVFVVFDASFRFWYDMMVCFGVCIPSFYHCVCACILGCIGM